MNKVKVLAIIEGIQEDYMSDMIWLALCKDNEIEFRSNIYPNYFFKENNTILQKSNTHTLYNKLDSSIKKKDLNKKKLLKTIKNKYYDFVVYPSIRRCSLFFNEVTKIYKSNKVIVIDGEDDPCISIKHLNQSIYFKRELLELYKFKKINPISFFLPKYILQKVNKFYNFKKKSLLAHCDPRDRKTYIYKDEENYYKQYSEAYFAFTQYKGGWDCLRHYEILASGCVPFFDDIEHKPKYTMSNYPLKLQEEANKLFKKQRNQYLSDKDISAYNAIREGFQDWLNQESLNYGSKFLRALLKDNKIVKLSKKLTLLNLLELKLLNFFAILIWSWSQASSSNQAYKKIIRFFYYIYLRFKN